MVLRVVVCVILTTFTCVTPYTTAGKTLTYDPVLQTFSVSSLSGSRGSHDELGGRSEIATPARTDPFCGVGALPLTL